MSGKPDKWKIYDQLSFTFAHAQETKIAMAAWRALRIIAPRGHLFLVKPTVVETHRPRYMITVDEIRSQIFHDLDLGIPYSTIAKQVHLPHRRVRELSDEWKAASKEVKDHYRREWAELRRRQDTIIGDARSIATELERQRKKPTLLQEDDQ